MFTGSSAIRLIRFGHHLLGDAPDLLVSGVVVAGSPGYHRLCIDILLDCWHLENSFLVLLLGNLQRLDTLLVFVAVWLWKVGILCCA